MMYTPPPQQIIIAQVASPPTFNFHSVIIPGDANIQFPDVSYTFGAGAEPLFTAFRSFMRIFLWVIFATYLVTVYRRGR